MRLVGKVVLLLSVLSIPAPAAERINHAGRILGPMPVVTNAISFNTPEADAVMAGLQVFPRDNAWNEDISRRPFLTNSDAMIAQIFSELNAVGTNSPKLRAFKEMNFIFVPNNQPLIPIQFVTYPGESDPSPYPIPTNLPIEGWPSAAVRGVTPKASAVDAGHDCGLPADAPAPSTPLPRRTAPPLAPRPMPTSRRGASACDSSPASPPRRTGRKRSRRSSPR